MARNIRRYADFWPHYLREHADPRTRALHYVGTALTFFALAIAFKMGGWWWAAIPLAGYGFAWAAHFGVEKNRPGTAAAEAAAAASDD